MRRANYPAWTNPWEETIDRLKNELDQARRTILLLMPQNVQPVLSSYFSCEARQQTYGWESDVADKIIALAQILPPAEGSFLSDRAYCPLCGDGSSSPYQRGFSIPEGLHRHLVGWGGNVHQCRVMEAAVSLARDYWHDKFHPAEEAEEAEKRDRLAQRKKRGTLYRTSPYLEPQLIDEAIGFGAAPRDESELAWAEQRLEALGFQITREGNVKCYTNDRESFVAYADPRTRGGIEITVFRKPVSGRGRGRRTRPAVLTSFRLMDTWRNDLRGKYESRLPKMSGT
jgi:hypothetical protein